MKVHMDPESRGVVIEIQRVSSNRRNQQVAGDGPSSSSSEKRDPLNCTVASQSQSSDNPCDSTNRSSEGGTANSRVKNREHVAIEVDDDDSSDETLNDDRKEQQPTKADRNATPDMKLPDSSSENSPIPPWTQVEMTGEIAGYFTSIWERLPHTAVRPDQITNEMISFGRDSSDRLPDTASQNIAYIRPWQIGRAEAYDDRHDRNPADGTSSLVEDCSNSNRTTTSTLEASATEKDAWITLKPGSSKELMMRYDMGRKIQIHDETATREDRWKEFRHLVSTQKVTCTRVSTPNSTCRNPDATSSHGRVFMVSELQAHLRENLSRVAPIPNYFNPEVEPSSSYGGVNITDLQAADSQCEEPNEDKQHERAEEDEESDESEN